MKKKTILLTLLGSFGDLHPMMGLAAAFKSHGHAVIIATSEHYHSYIKGAGFRFQPVTPNLDPDDAELIDAVLDPRHGPERLYKNHIFPALEQSVHDLLPLAAEADAVTE